MKEVRDILRRIQREKEGKEPALALATVVSVEGSSYRRPGARMLVGPEGILEGLVSGGCLEKDVWLRSLECLAKQTPSLVCYDSYQDGDEFFGLGLGCQGIIRILIEPISFPRHEPELSFLSKRESAREGAVLAKIVEVHGIGELRPGAALFLDPESEVSPAQLLFHWRDPLVQEASQVLKEEKSRSKHYEGACGSFEVFYEYLKPEPQLIIFGTGLDSKPLLRLSRELGYRTVAVDLNGHKTRSEADCFISGDLDTLPETLAPWLDRKESFLGVIMTHHYPTDLELLKFLLPLPVRYLGLLGSRQRTERLLAALSGAATRPRAALHAPIGLDIGAETPEEIALSILAEIRAVLSQRPGTSLRHRNQAIHAPVSTLA